MATTCNSSGTWPSLPARCTAPTQEEGEPRRAREPGVARVVVGPPHGVVRDVRHALAQYGNANGGLARGRAPRGAGRGRASGGSGPAMVVRVGAWRRAGACGGSRGRGTVAVRRWRGTRVGPGLGDWCRKGTQRRAPGEGRTACGHEALVRWIFAVFLKYDAHCQVDNTTQGMRRASVRSSDPWVIMCPHSAFQPRQCRIPYSIRLIVGRLSNRPRKIVLIGCCRCHVLRTQALLGRFLPRHVPTNGSCRLARIGFTAECW